MSVLGARAAIAATDLDRGQWMQVSARFHARGDAICLRR
jgi:hypothetical protein